MSLLHRSSSVPVMTLTQTWSDSSTLQPDSDDDHVPLFELGIQTASPHSQPACKRAIHDHMAKFQHGQAQAHGFKPSEKQAQLRKSVSFCLNAIDLELQSQAFRADSNVSSPSHKGRAPQKGLLKVSHNTGTVRQMPTFTLVDSQDDIPIALLRPGALQMRLSLDQGMRQASIHSDEIKLAPPDIMPSNLAHDENGVSEKEENNLSPTDKPQKPAEPDRNTFTLPRKISLSRKAVTSTLIAPGVRNSTTVKWNWIWLQKRVDILDRRVIIECKPASQCGRCPAKLRQANEPKLATLLSLRQIIVQATENENAEINFLIFQSTDPHRDSGVGLMEPDEILSNQENEAEIKRFKKDNFLASAAAYFAAAKNGWTVSNFFMQTEMFPVVTSGHFGIHCTGHNNESSRNATCPSSHSDLKKFSTNTSPCLPNVRIFI
ncbi:hypothetical protein BC830DRAFT_1217689, partial [Chytriomyces sp. MP71]